jgi:hypothetical protein
MKIPNHISFIAAVALEMKPLSHFHIFSCGFSSGEYGA